MTAPTDRQRFKQRFIIYYLLTYLVTVVTVTALSSESFPFGTIL